MSQQFTEVILGKRCKQRPSWPPCSRCLVCPARILHLTPFPFSVQPRTSKANLHAPFRLYPIHALVTLSISSINRASAIQCATFLLCPACVPARAEKSTMNAPHALHLKQLNAQGQARLCGPQRNDFLEGAIFTEQIRAHTIPRPGSDIHRIKPCRQARVRPQQQRQQQQQQQQQPQKPTTNREQSTPR